MVTDFRPSQFMPGFSILVFFIPSLTTTENERIQLKMASWTLLNLCGLILDRTDRSDPTALHSAEKPLLCPL
jgi:hypothetical protein